MDTLGNRVQYLSIWPCDNTQIYSTKNTDVFKIMFPKLSKGSDLYMFTKKSSIIYPKNRLLDIKKMVIILTQQKIILMRKAFKNFQMEN